MKAALDELFQLITVAILIILALSGCGGMTPSKNKDFWDQCIKFEGYGFSMLTQYGPFNFGKVNWERNIACDKDQKKDDPLGKVLKGPTA